MLPEKGQQGGGPGPPGETASKQDSARPWSPIPTRWAHLVWASSRQGKGLKLWGQAWGSGPCLPQHMLLPKPHS